MRKYTNEGPSIFWRVFYWEPWALDFFINIGTAIRYYSGIPQGRDQRTKTFTGVAAAIRAMAQRTIFFQLLLCNFLEAPPASMGCAHG